MTVEEGATLVFGGESAEGLDCRVWLGAEGWPAAAAGHNAGEWLARLKELEAGEGETARVDFHGWREAFNNNRVWVSGEVSSAAWDASNLGIAFGGMEPEGAAGMVAEGYFEAAESGEYEFQLKAALHAWLYVNGELVAARTGRDAYAAATGRAALAAGRNAVKIYYVMAGDLYRALELKYKGPSMAGFADVTKGMLWKHAEAGETRIGALAGAGRIALGDGGKWPEVGDAGGFGGEAVFDSGASAGAGSGAASLAGGAKMRFEGLGDEGWVTGGDGAIEKAEGERGVEFTLNKGGAAHKKAWMNTAAKQKVTGRWRWSFTLKTGETGYGVGTLGFVLHNQKNPQPVNSGAGSIWSGSGAYGVAYYCGGGADWGKPKFGWVKNGIAEAGYGGFGQTNILGGAELRRGVRVELEYDGEGKLAFRMAAADGSAELAMTNRMAGTDLAGLFGGGALLGVWYGGGGEYTEVTVGEMAFEDWGAAAGGGVRLVGGEGAVVAGSDRLENGRIGGELQVWGDAELAAEEGFALEVASGTWTFKPGASLKMGSGVRVNAGGAVVVKFAGELPKGVHTIADLRGAAGGGEGVEFEPEERWAAKGVKLRYANGVLRAVNSRSFTIIVR